jgi:hypothetical protein
MDTGAHFEISINGVPRTHRDVREIAIEAALYHKQRVPTEEVRVRDLRDGTVVTIGWTDGKAFVPE